MSLFPKKFPEPSSSQLLSWSWVCCASSPQVSNTSLVYDSEIVLRVKHRQHLDRVHYIYQCDRCGQIFKTEELLLAHRLCPASEICDVTRWQTTFDRNHGFTEAQKDKIRKIKPNKIGNSWNRIFGVLFPEDAESSYPPQCKSPAAVVGKSIPQVYHPVSSPLTFPYFILWC